MRRSKAETAKTRADIVQAATRLFREHGFDRVSVADVMRAAGLTHGGFYNHFRSKEDLQAAALDLAFKEKHDLLTENGSAGDPRGAARTYLERYLTVDHVSDLAAGCPIAGLASEAGRGGPEALAALDLGTRQTLDLLAKAFGDEAEAPDRAIEVLSRAIGALVLARSVSDPGLREQIIEVARRSLPTNH